MSARGFRWIGLVLALGVHTGAAQRILPPAAVVEEVIRRADDYWLANNLVGDAGWARATYYTGNQRAFRVLAESRYQDWALAWGAANQWKIGPEGSGSADAYCCGQTYSDLYRLDPQPVYLADLKAQVNALVAAPAVDAWSWIDAFYMAAPVLARLGNLTGDTNYFQKLWLMYDDMKTRRALFDSASSLWYRDARFIYPALTTLHGQKVFWSRGNGWVFAGLARVLEQMPADAPHRADYIAMFQAMAAALKNCQGPDGLWRASLADFTEFPNPETSGSGFFLYGIAWGVRNGFLSPADYADSIALGWQGLTNLVLNSAGLVGYVQPVGDRPAATSASTTADFGVGAFLLAGSEIYLQATNSPALRPWAGLDRIIVDSDFDGRALVTLDATPTEVYRSPAGPYTWWEGGTQILAGAVGQVSLPLGQHLITLQVVGSDAVVYSNSVRYLVVQPVVSPPTLKLQFGFEGSGTTAVDSVSGATMSLVNSAGAAADLRGAGGTGVGGLGKALDLTAGAMGGTGPAALTASSASVGFGVVGSFTASVWLKPMAGVAVGFPRYFIIGANGTADQNATNTVSLLSNGSGSGGDAQSFLNTSQNNTTLALVSNRWRFAALTWDGATLRFFTGDETNACAPVNAFTPSPGALNFGSAFRLFLGNNNARNRCFKGYLDDFRFYAGAGDLAFVETLRQSGVPSATPLPPVGLAAGSCAGQATLSWSASAGATGYLIRRSGIPGAETNYVASALNQLTDAGVVPGSTYYYVVAATNILGASANSAEANVTVTSDSAFDLTQAPVSQTTCAGATAAFSVTANAPNLDYHWQYSPDGSTWYGLGGAGPSFTTWPVSAADNGTRYRVVVSNPCLTLVSTAATLMVQGAASIIVQPASQTAAPGWPVAFAIQASGGGLTYQWRRDGTNLSDGPNINGAASPALMLAGVSPADSGSTFDCVVSNSCHSAVSSVPARLTVAHTLQLQFAFEDNGTSTTDSLAGVTLNLLDATGAPADLHGTNGSGVAGLGKALDLRSAAAQGGAGPIALTQGNSAIDFGTFNTFTVTLWLKPATTLLAGVFPRFFTLGADGLTDRGIADSLQLLSNGNLQPATTAVQGFVNTLQTDTANFGAFNLPVGRWSFLALSYDGAALKLYGGSAANPVVLATSMSFPAGPLDLGNSWTLFLGNRLSRDRAFLGELDDVRFYTGAAPLSYLESVRQAALLPARPLIITTLRPNQLALRIKTMFGPNYVLESAPVLGPTPVWTPVLTNAGTGDFITNTVPLNPAGAAAFFRYDLR